MLKRVKKMAVHLLLRLHAFHFGGKKHSVKQPGLRDDFAAALQETQRGIRTHIEAKPLSLSSRTNSPIPGFGFILYRCHCSKHVAARRFSSSVSRRESIRLSAASSDITPISRSTHSGEIKTVWSIFFFKASLEITREHTPRGIILCQNISHIKHDIFNHNLLLLCALRTIKKGRPLSPGRASFFNVRRPLPQHAQAAGEAFSGPLFIFRRDPVSASDHRRGTELLLIFRLFNLHDGSLLHGIRPVFYCCRTPQSRCQSVMSMITP